MRISKSYYYFLLFAIGFCISLSLPFLVQVATYTPPKYPLVLYSSQLHDMVRLDYSDRDFPMTDSKGNKYTPYETDSLLPLLNFRQLVADNRLPDSINHVPVNARTIANYQLSFRLSPTRIHKPDPMAYPIFESMPRRVGNIVTDHVFLLDDEVTVYDVSKNILDYEATQLFRAELEHRDFSYPAKWVVGNTNPRKKYDEGYFVLDNDGKLFQMKLVNDRPFIRNTHLQTPSGWHSFHPYEPNLHNFYGILVSNDGKMARFNIDDNGVYFLQWLDVPNIDPDVDVVKVIGNFMYWNVTVSKPEGEYTYALSAWFLNHIASDFIPVQLSVWDYIGHWIFPFVIRLKHNHTEFIEPRIMDLNPNAIWFNIILVGFYIYRKRRYGSPVRWYALASVLIFGIGASLAMSFLPKNDVY